MRIALFLAASMLATPAFAQVAKPIPYPEAEVTEEAAPAPKIGGLRIQVQAGLERANLSEEEGGTTYVADLGSSFAYGAEVGFDVAVSSGVTVGPYVSYDIGNSDLCDSFVDGLETFEVCFEAKSNLSAGLRAGFVTGGGELYVGLGYAKYDFDYAEETRNFNGTVIQSYSSDDGDEGIDFMLGYNHMISKSLYAGIGMRVSELGDFEGTTLNLQRFQGQLNLGARF